MKDYYPEDSDTRVHTAPPWMPLFVSLMLVLLTLFIFLTTFAKGDKRKIHTFKQEFRKSLMMSGEGKPGAFSIVDSGLPTDPVQHIINRMKSEGINKKLMDEFLTLQQIKDLEVRDGKRGVVIVVPEVVGFLPEGDRLSLTEKSKIFLHSISYLVSELPYLVEVKGYSISEVPKGFSDPLQFSALRAHTVYLFFLEQGIAPEKLKVSGCGDAFAKSDVPQDKVEIIFKSPDL